MGTVKKAYAKTVEEEASKKNKDGALAGSRMMM